MIQVVERGVSPPPQQYSHCDDLLLRDRGSIWVWYNALDMICWILLGSSFSLVFILSGFTWYYRKKVKTIKLYQTSGSRSRSKTISRSMKKEKPKEEGRSKFSFRDRDRGVSERRHQTQHQTKHQTQHQTRTDDDIQMMIENIKLLSGGGELYHEQYNEHGVRIENQCFP